MKLFNIKNNQEVVSFKEAVLKGLANDGGLYLPKELPTFNIGILAQDFVPRSTFIMQQLLKDDLASDKIEKIVRQAFNFPITLKPISDNIYALELFWGPTLAFKDFGVRFMAGLLSAITAEPLTIITATSGDTGAAVAHAFHGIPNINVVILYPHQRISPLQEKLFCTLGDNIHCFAIEGDFDDCQALVKQCFADKTLKLNLNSANSINISRVLAQSLYYFEALARLPNREEVVISVPSGNFGDLTAGLLAKQMGLPIKSFVAATNVNDTVPRYLQTGKWDPHQTIVTFSNAMDVSRPNNWPRIEEIVSSQHWNREGVLRSIAVSEAQTKEAMQALYKLGYIADPHSAIAYYGLRACLKSNETGVFLCTAHPAKFSKSVGRILGKDIPLPPQIEAVAHKPILSKVLTNKYKDILSELTVMGLYR